MHIKLIENKLNYQYILSIIKYYPYNKIFEKKNLNFFFYN